ncbi:hypothetical protein F5B22DRAFT_611040 [Xylaria bambusicola]|uniref:uncharacterized protein n=1 Tax=Xylaria bambusicola TaxID=326684 RepID=UPI0020082B7E|nr:uncharacterized protein F5B22DRAFT_611040 [Xylaria bambusicola]KAI0514578.1 hypothetical protein F5B22DRAFT_611040 [Xylaria bambusicola]
MEPHDGLYGPPPPYSETDIHRHAHGSRNGHLSGADDDASIAPSSSHSNIIDTPPESPHDAHFSFAGPNDDHRLTSSAQDYFDSRPPRRLSHEPNLSVVVEITLDATPADFPYPNWAPDRDVSEQDWQTFINYLLPGHAARANSHIIDRKIRVASDAQSSASEAITRAQLTPLKSSTSASTSTHDFDATLREWNNGFFEPRGVTVRCTPLTEPAAEPGIRRANPADPEHSEDQSQQSRSWWRNPFAFINDNNGSLRLGPLHIEGDRVAVGSSFEADSNGVRWQGQSNGAPLFEASSRGVRWSGQPSPSIGHPFAHQYGPWAGPFGGGRGRGRDHGHEPRRRNHSRSSTSSSSSSQSTDSDSSIGSLPSWDDLKDVQLPVTKQSIHAWLSHPDQPVTKDMVKQAEIEIEAAKNFSTPPHDPSWDKARENLRREVKDLLQQFKVLKKQQKASKKKARKEHRQQKRALKQERRERKHTERHERRAHEHESRRSERATRRAERDAERNARRFRHHRTAPGPSVPHPAAPPSFPPFPGGFGALFGRGSFGQGPPHASVSGFHRGFDGRGRGRGRGHGPGRDASYNVAEQANHAAGKDLESTLAQAERVRENALALATEQQRAARAMAAEESRRAVEESRRAVTAAVSRAAADTKLAQACVLEGQLSAKTAQIQALEIRIADADKWGHGEKKMSVDARAHDLQAVERLEEEMALLARKVETLRFEADEELARGLADGDENWAGYR